MKRINLDVCLYEKEGKPLALSIGVHIEAKKVLKMFIFQKQALKV